MKLSSAHNNWIGLAAGVVVAWILYYFNPFSVNEQAAKTLAVAALMIIWWISEALPLPVVALLPIVLFPLLRISTIEQATASYANPVIFLFMGGFLLGLAIEKWNLHKRIALGIVRMTGTSGDRIILGFIIATGLLSMWLSNTATTMMMFPIALSVIHVMKNNDNGQGSVRNFSLVLMLVIAFASNLSVGTIIGTPPNVAYVAYIKQKYDYQVDFLNWMLLCTPLSILLMAALYWVLVKWLYPNRIKFNTATHQLIHNELKNLGPLSVPEKRVLWIFTITAVLWMTKDIINASQKYFILDDTIIAVICAVSLFICPAGKKDPDDPEADSILEWGDTSKMAWGILLLFGGGITLASALERAGLIHQLGQWMGQFSGNGLLLVFIITFVSLFLSEVMSNVAQVIVLSPVVSGLADAIGMNPLLLGIPMTLAASCASMLPMGTPPNAIVFASGYIKLRQMTRAGFVMNLIAIILITLFCWFLLPLVI